jgi:peptidoglycan-associated lipoprotein
MRKTLSAASVLLALGMAGGSSSADEPRADDTVKTGKHVAEAKIYFEFDSDQLSADARAELDQTATWIMGKKTGLILVEGHTDKVGGAPYNKDLGERRGEAAKAYLVAKGVPAERIRVLSYGEGLPARDTEGRADENRRIVMYAVQKEPIVEQETKVVEVPVVEKETVYVDRDVTPAPLGIQFMAGAGLINQVDDETSDLTELGGAWDARAAFFNRNLIGFEAAYVGSIQTVNALGLDDNAQLMGNGLEADVRLNLLRDGFFRPYAFGGVGWTHYNLTNTETADAAVEDGDDVLVIPAGVGVGFHVFRGVTLDLRGTVRQTFGEDTFDPMAAPDDEMGMENWSSTAQLGFEF